MEADTKLRHIKMSPAEWHKVTDNMVQRDTLKHLTGASRPGGHLSKAHPTHQHVFAAELPSGKLIKLDGHSRSLAWHEEILEAPKQLQVTLYPCKNKQEAIELYSSFDASVATENQRDKLFGSMRYFNFEPHHGYMLQNTGLISCMQYTVFPNKWVDLKNITFIQLIQPWIETLKLIDGGDFPNHNLFRSPIMLAMLMSFRLDRNRAMSFWAGYHDDIGKKSANSCDGIFAARDCYTIMKHEQENKWGRKLFSAYTPYFLYCYSQWSSDSRLKRFPSIEGKRWPKDMLSVREWWEVNLGELDQPQIRPEKKTDEQMALI